MLKQIIYFCAVVVAGAPAAAAAQGRPMTIDDLITAVRVSEPQLSPDGTSVMYVRTTTDGTSGKRNADIFTVPTDASAAPRRLFGTDKSETSPRYSPDGKTIAFISNRDGAPQIYLAPADGGEPAMLTKLAAGAQAPYAFSPDGKKIAFISDVYPDCADEACNKKQAEEAGKNPVKVRHVTHLLYRHWTEWRENQRHHIFVIDVATGETKDVTPGDFDSPPYFYEDNALAFSPDSTRVAFVSNREGNDREAYTTNNDIWIVPIAGGDAKRLTTNTAADVQPVWTSDGKSLIVRAQRRAGFEADRWYLEVYDVGTASHRSVFETPDLSVEDFVLAPDGRTIYFTAQARGVVNIYSVGYPAGTPKLATAGGAISSMDAGRDIVVFSKSSMTAPAEIFAMNPAGAVKQLTHENDAWLKTVALNPAESLTVPGAAGAQVQYWLIKPPNFDATKKYPVIFLIHGGPQGAWEDAWSFRWNPELWAAQGYVIAAPNPRGSTGFGQKFVDEISQDWGGKVMVDIDAVFNTVEKLPFVDPQRMGIAGASYGGYAVDWIIGHTNRFKAAVTHDGVYNIESMYGATEELWFPEWDLGGPTWTTMGRANAEKWSPHRFAQNIRTPTLIITNELDFRVPVDQGLQLFTALRRQGVASEMLVFPDEGHWVLKALNSRYWHQQVFGWMERWVKAPASTNMTGR